MSESATPTTTGPTSRPISGADAAFPLIETYVSTSGGRHEYPHTFSMGGLSIRAWLAGQALANPKICDLPSVAGNADWAVEQADAVIARLNRPPASV